MTQRQFRLTDSTEVFAAKVLAIREAIADVLQRDLNEFDIKLDSRSALHALNSPVPSNKEITESKDFVKR